MSPSLILPSLVHSYLLSLPPSPPLLPPFSSFLLLSVSFLSSPPLLPPSFLCIHSANICGVCPVPGTVLGTRSSSLSPTPGQEWEGLAKTSSVKVAASLTTALLSGCQAGLSSCPSLALSLLALKCMHFSGPLGSGLGVCLQWLFLQLQGILNLPNLDC